jgi:hypothetical protein
MDLRPVFGCTNSSVRRTSSTRSPQTSRAISMTSFSWNVEDGAGAGAAGGMGLVVVVVVWVSRLLDAPSAMDAEEGDGDVILGDRWEECAAALVCDGNSPEFGV